MLNCDYSQKFTFIIQPAFPEIKKKIKIEQANEVNRL